MAPNLTRLALAAACSAAFFATPAHAEADGFAPGDNGYAPYPCAGINLVSQGRTLQPISARGSLWVEGAEGAEYAVEAFNRCPRRVLAVVSVDGLNVLDGSPARASGAQGYVLEPGSRTLVRGWRKSLTQSAAFYFTYPSDSYGARVGKDQNLGVVGAAFTYEKLPEPTYEPRRSWIDGRAKESGAADSSMNLEGAAAKSARSSAPAPAAAPAPSLGTGHGSLAYDSVRRVAFEPEPAPFARVAIRYESREGLVRNGVLPRKDHRRMAPNPFPEDGFVPNPPSR